MLLRHKLHAYARLMRIDRPIGTLLLMWPCMMALFLAGDGMPDLKVLAIFVVGVVIMRANGCIINDYADRHLDAHVERTQSRPLVSGDVSTKEALLLFVVLGLLAFSLVVMLNPLVVKMSFVGIILTVMYPYMKRVTNMPQMFLGVVWSWSIPMAYAAQLGHVPIEAWWLFAANWCWTVAYDTMYAMVDRDDDLKVGIKSTAILFGHFDRQWIAFFQFAALGCFIMAGHAADRGLVYALGVITFVAFSSYQQYLIYDRERAPCFKAFLNNNWAGFALFVSLGIDYMVSFKI
ncbi:4-hydroxybenzoate octaprenyltransferase [Shewanella intestini]|uniref:4-hydroxybenzoate octaprenyltransferase n=1 Tax=Shewanella intestini TaxID=2017544 RepID=A0ABS5I2X6_9GAMM|nr:MULTISPECIES: 4-hydroxybenzoate octaprenyltransferase [Shewanella]MBR9728374.1 4-hydroxybenzoate octaprenyltransferase [Shewanella intestini]MRG36716.1 4-hydroxybenzoate octaprenyltransferase [Shewanella sp. XMDDZSB0408]